MQKTTKAKHEEKICNTLQYHIKAKELQLLCTNLILRS